MVAKIVHLVTQKCNLKPWLVYCWNFPFDLFRLRVIMGKWNQAKTNWMGERPLHYDFVGELEKQWGDRELCRVQRATESWYSCHWVVGPCPLLASGWPCKLSSFCPPTVQYSTALPINDNAPELPNGSFSYIEPLLLLLEGFRKGRKVYNKALREEKVLKKAMAIS